MLDTTLPSGIAREPGEVVIPGVNWQGLQTLYLKEVRRFFKVQLQTVWAPAITTLMFLAIFALALGRASTVVMGVPFTNFLGPGLIVMGMIQNSFANTSSSLLIGKIQGTIVDVLMPPLSPAELLVAWVGGAVTRAWLVGVAVYLAMLLAPGVDVPINNIGVVLYFGTFGVDHARAARHPDRHLGRQVRPCRGGDQFHRPAADACCRAPSTRSTGCRRR